MSNKLKEIQVMAQKDPAFLGMLITNPKNALLVAKIELTEEKDMRTVELFARRTQKHLQNTAQAMGFKVQAGGCHCGVGIHCCNARVLDSMQ